MNSSKYLSLVSLTQKSVLEFYLTYKSRHFSPQKRELTRSIKRINSIDKSS